jgi:hypothetical protein
MIKTYKDEITLNKNERGCYILDTIKGCRGGMLYNGNGCYGNCYAKNIANRYCFNFNKTVKRKFYTNEKQIYFSGFKDTSHIFKIIKQINNISMPFIRIGEMGDPSECWGHTLSICNDIRSIKKSLVIVTKHWETIPENLLTNIEKLKLTINTSISALDKEVEIEHRLNQFNMLRNVCNSVLRIVSCDFNINNNEGKRRLRIQNELFNNMNNIDTAFRPDKNNYFVLNDIIKIEKTKFLKSNVLVSKFNKNVYFGKCDNCPDMCGILK